MQNGGLTESGQVHKPVLAAEVADLLRVRAGGTYVDGTLGSGGHARLVLERLGAGGRLFGIDRDGQAIERSRSSLAKWGGQCVFVHRSFADLAGIAEEHRIGKVDGILLDLGVSSEQLETPERGFSISRNGPLDMRMDGAGGKTAADLVNGLSVDELKAVIRRFGEEPAAGAIARAIVREREKAPIAATLRLAEIVSAAVGGRHGRIHPATRTFQAIRIAVNGELDALERGLEAGLRLLGPGGRMAVISFHSLEDRLVKNCFREHAGRYESLEGGGQVRLVKEPAVVVLTKRPVTASDDELEANPRSRSAKLRVAERAGEPE